MSQLPLSEALALLPPDIRQLVESLPPEEAQKVIERLLQQSEIEFRPLTEADLQAIKVLARFPAYGSAFQLHCTPPHGSISGP